MICPSKYQVQFVPIDAIKPSPKNDDLYGEVSMDTQMEALINSIRSRGLAEPLIVTADNFILSGHRRYYALRHLGETHIPVRVESEIYHDSNWDYHRLLAEYNPQRVKGVGTLLKEAMLQEQDKPASTLIYDHQMAEVEIEVDFEEVQGCKHVPDVSPAAIPFLKSVEQVIHRLQPFWPLTVRQIHYQLLNDPPLKRQYKESSKSVEGQRYRNDKSSYNALVRLLRSARYHGQIRMDVIDDATRPRYPFGHGFQDLQEFLNQELKSFLNGYHRSPQLDQPRHIEVLGEKNTLVQIIKPVCRDYYVPLSIGRGYGSIPVWRDIASRFRRSGKKAFTLITLSDYDPEGLDLADDAIRTLRDMFRVDVDCQRVGVTLDQIEELNLTADFNPAKESSSRRENFVTRTGGTETWELEALPPQYLQDHLRAAIQTNMDMDRYQQSLRRLEQDAEHLAELREELLNDLDFNLL